MVKRRTKQKLVPIKGQAIQFIGGEYIGMKGWLDDSRDKCPSMHYVIVNFGDEEYPTRVLTTNIAELTEPVTYVEHCLDQHPDIAKLMKKLCKALSECDLSDDDQVEVRHIFGDQLSSSIRKNKGRKAWMRVIEYKNKGKNKIHNKDMKGKQKRPLDDQNAMVV